MWIYVDYVNVHLRGLVFIMARQYMFTGMCTCWAFHVYFCAARAGRECMSSWQFYVDLTVISSVFPSCIDVRFLNISIWILACFNRNWSMLGWDFCKSWIHAERRTMHIQMWIYAFSNVDLCLFRHAFIIYACSNMDLRMFHMDLCMFKHALCMFQHAFMHVPTCIHACSNIEICINPCFNVDFCMLCMTFLLLKWHAPPSKSMHVNVLCLNQCMSSCLCMDVSHAFLCVFFMSFSVKSCICWRFYCPCQPNRREDTPSSYPYEPSYKSKPAQHVPLLFCHCCGWNPVWFFTFRYVLTFNTSLTASSNVEICTFRFAFLHFLA